MMKGGEKNPELDELISFVVYTNWIKTIKYVLSDCIVVTRFKTVEVYCVCCADR